MWQLVNAGGTAGRDYPSRNTVNVFRDFFVLYPKRVLWVKRNTVTPEQTKQARLRRR